MLIVGPTFSISEPNALPDIAAIGATAIDFPLDFGLMMDLSGGGAAIATIEPVDDFGERYQVVDFEPLPVHVRHLGHEGVVLDSQDGDWFVGITDHGTGAITIVQSEQVPDFRAPPFSRFGRWLEGFIDAAPASP